MSFTFDYSPEFKRMIKNMLRGRESLHFFKGYVTAHLGGRESNMDRFGSDTYPEIRYHCGDLKNKKTLDFGCGTGATTAVLATHCKNVTAFDISKESISICKRRIKEHGLSKRVDFFQASDFEHVAEKIGKFDLVILNALLEHIPLSKKGLRKRIIRTLFDKLKVNGFLFISGTPNRLWPIDMHTTGLWWIPWHSAGSERAFKKAVRKGRHPENDRTCSKGPLGLEERGAWGTTFFEIKKYLSGKSFEIVNLVPGHDKHLNYSRKMANKKRMFFDLFVYYLFTKWTRIPITAFAPAIENLVIRKTDDKSKWHIKLTNNHI